jgi:hypothetical protein
MEKFTHCTTDHWNGTVQREDPTVSGINRKVVLIGVQAWDIRLQGFYEIQACDLWTRPKNPNFDCLGLKIACLYLFSLERFQILSALA